MGMQTDVKSTYLTADGAIFAGPCRIKGILISPASTAGSLNIKNGGASGTSVFQSSWPASDTASPMFIPVPGEGLWCTISAYADVTDLTSVTVFYG